MVPASKAIKESYEHDCGPSVGRKTNDIGCSLPASLESFVQEATDNAQILGEDLRSHTFAYPSFERGAPTNVFLLAPNDVLAARSKLTEAALRLLQLAQGPPGIHTKSRRQCELVSSKRPDCPL